MSNISASINVSNIDKSKLYPGQKGLYLNATLIATPTSEYGDYMVVQDVLQANMVTIWLSKMSVKKNARLASKVRS